MVGIGEPGDPLAGGGELDAVAGLAGADRDTGGQKAGFILCKRSTNFYAEGRRDLRIYAQLLDARVDSWRDSNGNEVDAIVTVGPNKWAAFEVKLSPGTVDEAAASLLRFKASVDTSRHGEPSCLGVITSTGAGGVREDGVHVIPIGCLGP